MAVNPLAVVAIISSLAGHPQVASVASYLMSAVGLESTDDGVDRLVAMHLKSGLSQIDLYRNAPASERRRHLENAQRDFVDASNVEKDMLRVARADLYVSTTNRLLGEERNVVLWAEKAYSDLSTAEVLAWRVFMVINDNFQLAVHERSLLDNVGMLSPLCIKGREQENAQINLFKTWYRQGESGFYLNKYYRSGRTTRNAKLTEIYAYKTPLAAFLRSVHSRIKELNYPVTVPLDDYERGAEVAVRQTEADCKNH